MESINGPALAIITDEYRYEYEYWYPIVQYLQLVTTTCISERIRYFSTVIGAICIKK